MEHDLESLPMLSPRQAYLAMLEFLKTEFELSGEGKTVHLGGLIAEMEPEANGSTSDPGAALTFVDAIQTVLAASYKCRWKISGADA